MGPSVASVHVDPLSVEYRAPLELTTLIRDDVAPSATPSAFPFGTRICDQVAPESNVRKIMERDKFVFAPAITAPGTFRSANNERQLNRFAERLHVTPKSVLRWAPSCVQASSVPVESASAS